MKARMPSRSAGVSSPSESFARSASPVAATRSTRSASLPVCDRTATVSPVRVSWSLRSKRMRAPESLPSAMYEPAQRPARAGLAGDELVGRPGADRPSGRLAGETGEDSPLPVGVEIGDMRARRDRLLAEAHDGGRQGRFTDEGQAPGHHLVHD